MGTTKAEAVLEKVVRDWIFRAEIAIESAKFHKVKDNIPAQYIDGFMNLPDNITVADMKMIIPEIKQQLGL